MPKRPRDPSHAPTEQSTRPTQEYLNQLYHVYGKRPVGRDVFGRRAALPSEIARRLNTLPPAQPPGKPSGPHTAPV
jgi:hypothetical protein